MDGIIIVNKEKNMTSHDVVNRLRKIYHTKKVGHAGTLDPLATGVLVVGVNKATKALQFLMSHHKTYQATLNLGTSTTTYDSEGEILEEKPFTGYTNLEEVLQSFLGKQIQTPPIYSAIKVKGKKLYEYARNHEEVEIPQREIEITSIKLLNAYENIIQFEVTCSSGTYIRSLCKDIAYKLGYPGHMSELVRVTSGNFDISQAKTLEELEVNPTIIPLSEAFTNYPKIIIEDEMIVKNGKRIASSINSQVAIYNKQGEILAIYGPSGEGDLKSIRGLF